MQWFPFLNSSGGDAWRAVKTDRFIMAVTEPAPFSLELEAPSGPLVRGGELVIPVKVRRRPGFDEPIDFVCDSAPLGVTYQPAATIPGDRGEGTLRVTADVTAPLGSGPLMVVAYTRRVANQHAGHGGAGEVQVAAPLILLTVAEPYLALSSDPTTVRRSGAVEYRWTVTPKSPFAGEALVKAELQTAEIEVRMRRKQVDETLGPLRQQAAETARIAAAAYREGGTDLLRLLDAQRLQLETQLVYVQALVDYRLAVVNLETAMGANQ